MDKSQEAKVNLADSTTAPPSFASSPPKRPTDSRTNLLSLLAGLTNPATRPTAARALATRAGADDLLIFICDRDLDVLLPAPGFQQTLPKARAWRQFLQSCSGEPFCRAKLSFPTADSRITATGVMAEDRSVLVLLGGNPKMDEAADICVLLPIIASAFRGERTAAYAEGQAIIAKQSAVEARLLAASLDRARAELRRMLADARDANAAKDRFLAVLSHELRTPLTPVLMVASAMESDPNLSPQVRADISMIRRNVELEGKLIDDLLDLTRIANNKIRLDRKIVDAHELLEDAIAVSRGDLESDHAQLNMDLAATHHHIKADPARLQQVFWNLIRNALKFTPATGRVLITTRNVLPNTFTLDVTDTGRGIIPEALPRIFDAFEQGDLETTRQFGGLGLGLAISKTLVEMHGGKLRAESRGAGTGASFILDLEIAHEEVERAEAQSRGTDGEFDSQRILLVEDHVATSQLMLRLLRKRGHEVQAAHTKADAIQLGRQQSFDIVISDLGLPDGNGYEVMEALRETSRVVGIALSGYGMEADIQKSAQAGFAFHLTKPVDTHRLYSTIDRIAETRVIKA